MIVVVSVSQKPVDQTAHRCDQWGVPFVHGGISPHDRSRGLMASKALNKWPTARWLLWLDDDILVDQEAALSLPRTAEREGAVLCSGLYVCRHAAAQNQLALNISYSGAGNGFSVGDEGSVVSIAGCGFGLVATSRDLLERYPAPGVMYTEWPYHDAYLGKAWFQPKVRGQEHLGEDRSFCLGVRENNLGAMVADTRILAEHGGYSVLETMRSAGARVSQ